MIFLKQNTKTLKVKRQQEQRQTEERKIVICDCVSRLCEVHSVSVYVRETRQTHLNRISNV